MKMLKKMKMGTSDEVEGNENANGNENENEENEETNEREIREEENEDVIGGEAENINENENATDNNVDVEPAANVGEEMEDTTDEIMDRLYGPRNTSHGLRPRKPRDYGHLHATTDT